MGFIRTLIILGIIVAVVGLVAYDPSREYIKNVFIYSIIPAISGAHASLVGSEWWQIYQLYIMVPPAFILGIFLTAMYYKGKIKMWQWGAKKAVEQAYGTKQPAPAPTPTPLVPEPQKEEATA